MISDTVRLVTSPGGLIVVVATVVVVVGAVVVMVVDVVGKVVDAAPAEVVGASVVVVVVAADVPAFVGPDEAVGVVAVGAVEGCAWMFGRRGMNAVRIHREKLKRSSGFMMPHSLWRKNNKTKQKVMVDFLSSTR